MFYPGDDKEEVSHIAKVAYVAGSKARVEGRPYLDYLTECARNDDERSEWKQGWIDEDRILRTGR